MLSDFVLPGGGPASLVGWATLPILTEKPGPPMQKPTKKFGWEGGKVMPFPKVRLAGLVGRSCDAALCRVGLMYVWLHDLKQEPLPKQGELKN